jgi:long-chain acyl-CoA synthetase
MPEPLPTTLVGLLTRAQKLWPDSPYLQVRVGQALHSLTFGEVTEQAEIIARTLVRKGVQPGDRVALLSENRPSWVISYFAILLTGGVVVPIDSLLSPAEIVNVLLMAKSRLIVTSSRFLEMLQTVEAFDEISAGHLLVDRDLRPADQTGPTTALFSPRSGDTAALLFTSGTTGFSKGVVLSHANLCADVQAIVDAGVLHSGDHFLLLLPLHHTYSSTVNMLGTLALGCPALFATSFKSRDIVDDVRIGRISMLVGVPQVFEKLMTSLGRAVSDSPLGKRVLFRVLYALSAVLYHAGLPAGRVLFRSLREKAGMATLRHMVSGGAALPPQIHRFFQYLGFEMLQGYGLTETSPVLSVNRPHHIRVGSVGPALPGIELRIDSPDKDGIGEICARGPVVMQGYYENPQATAEVLKDGWFHTGDAGYLDRSGRLHITGRIKNVIVTGAGKNVYPEEIEAHLNLSPYILESLVVGRKDKRGVGEGLAAVIVPDKEYVECEIARGRSVDVEAEVKQAVDSYNHTAPTYRRIRDWKIREQEFEKTSSRKIRRYLYTKKF